ncbi:MAG: hypothetical protein ABSE49_24165 [Polyangiaceae bacterium]|jgi:hypothetical protein
MRQLVGVAWATAIAAAVAACGGSTSTLGGAANGAQVNGTVDGVTMTVVDQVGVSGTVTTNGSTGSYAGAVITNIAGTCSVVQSHANPPNAQALSLVVYGSGTTVGPGTYTVGSTAVSGAQVTFAAQDAMCTSTASADATGGTVTLSVVNGTSIEGSFDVTFGSDHVSGTFDAPVCAVPTTTGTTTPPCGG